jgi:HSP20 family protein
MSQIATERERRPASRQQSGSGQEVVPGQQAHWATLEQIPERMRRMLEQTLGSFGTPALLSEAAAWTPFVDIEEEDDAYVIEAELPGVKRDDINIELVGNELSVTGEIKERERQGVVRRRTRRVGRFDYRVALPNQVDPKKIEAKLSEGVLTVRVPKSERAQRQRIEVKGS